MALVRRVRHPLVNTPLLIVHGAHGRGGVDPPLRYNCVDRTRENGACTAIHYTEATVAEDRGVVAFTRIR